MTHPDIAMDTAIRLAREPLLREIATLKEELAVLRTLVPLCSTCAFRSTPICPRCAENPDRPPAAPSPQSSVPSPPSRGPYETSH